MLLKLFRQYRIQAICKFLQDVKTGSNDPYHLLGIPKETFGVYTLEDIVNTTQLLGEGVCRLETSRARNFYPFNEINLKYLDDGSLKIEFLSDNANPKNLLELCSKFSSILGEGKSVPGFNSISDDNWLHSLQSVCHNWDCNESTQITFYIRRPLPSFILLLIQIRPLLKS